LISRVGKDNIAAANPTRRGRTRQQTGCLSAQRHVHHPFKFTGKIKS
jgi:hypothetical protein